MLRCLHSVSGSSWVITWDRGSSSSSRSSSREAWPWGAQAWTCLLTWPPEAWVTLGSPRPTHSSSPTRPATVPVQAWPHHLPLPAPSPPLSLQACPLSLPIPSSTCMAPPLPPPPPPLHRWWWETQTWWADSTGQYSAPKCSTVPFSFPTQVLLPHPGPPHTSLGSFCVCLCLHTSLCVDVTSVAQHHVLFRSSSLYWWLH